MSTDRDHIDDAISYLEERPVEDDPSTLSAYIQKLQDAENRFFKLREQDLIVSPLLEPAPIRSRFEPICFMDYAKAELVPETDADTTVKVTKKRVPIYYDCENPPDDEVLEKIRRLLCR